MIRNRKQMYIVVGVFALVLMLFTTTYAFFNYTRTGVANVIKTGRITFNSSQGNSINLTNVFPIDVSDGVPDDASKVGTVTINITGDTTYSEGIEYLVSAVNVNNTSGSGANAKQLPISIDVVVTNNTENNPATSLGTVDSDYFTNRGTSVQTSIYKVLASNTISNNKELLVGYIKSGETGIDGNIVIRAYIDASKVAISDTYPEGEVTHTEGEEPNQTIVTDYYNGTTSNWVNNRVVFTTSEWNALQTNGVSFQVKVEANEGIWVEEPLTAFGTIKKNVITPANPINFGNISSDTNGKGLYILPGTESDTNPIYYYRGAVDNNNVIFGGFCWLMVRTTETGGIKMIYNGVATGTTDNPTCENAGGTARQLASTSKINTNYTSMSDVGYMYNQRYAYSSGAAASGSIFGKDVEWNGTSYLVIDDTSGTASSNTTLDANHHYTCGTASTTTCTSVRYYYYNSGSAYYYITLTNGDTIEDALYKMTGNGSSETKTKNAGYKLNTTSSVAKTNIENWFKTNLTNEVDASKTNYQEYLEDTTWCNDRSYSVTTGMGTYEEAGWNPNGGSITTNQFFAAGGRIQIRNYYSSTNVPVMTCPNVTDQFRVGNSEAKLNYPVGLLTVDEIILAGASGNSATYNGRYYLHNNESYYWSLSPSNFYNNDHACGYGMNYGYVGFNYVNNAGGLRPSVSLKPGTEFEEGGEGTTLKPYIVKIEE